MIAPTVPIVALAIWLSVVLSGGCSAEPEPEPEPTPTKEVPCHLALPKDPSATALGEEAAAELVLGFQGFVWVDLVAAMPAAPANKNAKVPFAYEIDGLPPKSSQLVTKFAADRRAPLRLLLTPADVKLLHDRKATLSMRIEVGDVLCKVSAVVTLRDDDPCIHVDDSLPCKREGKP